MGNKVYRVGIVGATTIAVRPPRPAPPAPFKGQYLTSLAHTSELAMTPRVDLVGLCDLKEDLLDGFQQTEGHLWPNCKLYTDYREMLATGDVDILAVVTGDNAHAQITIDGANAGVKGIIGEKPLATTIEEANAMIEACEANGVAYTIDHTGRFRPQLHKVRDTIRDGAIGDVSTLMGYQGGERAMMFRNGTHTIDRLVFFAESDPVQVSARLEDGFEDWDRYKGDGGKLPSNDPSASGLILFRNGVRAFYNADKGGFQGSRVQISGSRGIVHIDGEDATLTTAGREPREVVSRRLAPDSYQVEGLVAAYGELIDMIENGGESTSPSREARKTVQIMLGFLKSNQNGSRLVDVPQ